MNLSAETPKQRFRRFYRNFRLSQGFGDEMEDAQRLLKRVTDTTLSRLEYVFERSPGRDKAYPYDPMEHSAPTRRLRGVRYRRALASCIGHSDVSEELRSELANFDGYTRFRGSPLPLP